MSSAVVDSGKVLTFPCQMPGCPGRVTISSSFLVIVRTGANSFARYYFCPDCHRLYEEPMVGQEDGRPVFSPVSHSKYYWYKEHGLVLVPLNAAELGEYLYLLAETIKALSRDAKDRVVYLNRLRDGIALGHSQDCTLAPDQDPPVPCNCGVDRARELLESCRK